MNYEMIIRKCQEAKLLENTIKWNYEYKNNVLNGLLKDSLEKINDRINQLEEDLEKCNITIKALTN